MAAMTVVTATTEAVAVAITTAMHGECLLHDDATAYARMTRTKPNRAMR